jgi:hypothetical protein
VTKRVAVLTDAVSERHIFPHWHRYYGSLFGASNLFVLTYEGLSKNFQEFDLGGVIEIPVGYDDAVRQGVINGLVSALAACYETVIRVDSDEFLVVDPRVSLSLAAYVNQLAHPYVTARGFDVVQLLDEPPLNDAIRILETRAYAHPNSALNKTCIVTVPVNWSSGFHWATVYPKFDSLFMLHMKRVDIGWQLDWFRYMTEKLKHNARVSQTIKDYYAADEARITQYHRDVGDRRKLSGIDSWYREEFTKEFLRDIAFQKSDGMYTGAFKHELVLCQIPSEWGLLI